MANALIAKAERAIGSACALLGLGDVDGAANRAYYGMFDAARAALLVTGSTVSSEVARTHSGLIGAFGHHLVKTGRVSKEHGRLLNRAHEVRLIADYNGDSVEAEDALLLVSQAEIFVAAMRVLVAQDVI